MCKVRNNYIKSEYKYVRGNKLKGIVRWRTNYKGLGITYYSTEREAAIAVDRYLLMKGKQAVNVLVRKV